MLSTQNTNPFRRARYTLSAHRGDQVPDDTGLEVAFAGRSNAGKSSALNAITDNGNLARTSKTPGRTQQLIFFELDEMHRLVDLPGYGYAKVPEPVKRQWQQTLEHYLRNRQALQGLMLVVDVRHPLKPFDTMMLDWCRSAGMPVHVLLTKADKLKRGPASATLHKVAATLARDYPDSTAQLFSATSRQGVEQARERLRQWLQLDGPAEGGPKTENGQRGG